MYKDRETENTFELDGEIHLKDGSCCHMEGVCKCGGHIHYQPVYGGYIKGCDKCGEDY